MRMCKPGVGAFVFIVLLGFWSPVISQSVTARDWLDYRGAKSGHSHFENRATVNLAWGDFSAGVIYWAREPSRYNYTTASDTTFSSIVQYWVNFYTKNIELTAGSFTYAMGRGLLIDLYEREDIQIDHHCDGAVFNFHTRYIRISGFNAIAKWDDNSIVRGFSPELTIWKVKFGGEYAKILPKLSAEQELTGGYFSFDTDWLSLYGEFGRKNPIGGLQKSGQGFYGTVGLYTDLLQLTGEYKDYKDFAIRNTFSQYNNPPRVLPEPSYTLPSRHLKQVDLNDERGWQIDMMSTFGPFGAEILYAHAENHDSQNKFDQIIGEIEYENYSNSDILAKFLLDYQKEQEQTRLCPILDITYEPSWTDLGFNFIAEFQKAEEYNNVYSTVSVSYPRYGTAGIEGGNIENEGFVRVFGDIDYFDRAKIRLGYGKRPGGFTCSGGVCRYEEAFEGAELQIILTY